MRISALPSFLACPSSQLPTPNPFDPTTDAADMGQALHRCLALHVSGAVPVLANIAKDYRCDVDDLERLYNYGRAAWETVKASFPYPIPEHKLYGAGIQGTADVISIEGAAVLDWKTNRVKRSYAEQLHGYAAALVDEYGWPDSGQVKVVLVWLQFREIEVATVTNAEVENLMKRITDAKLDVGKRYSPGDACTFCRRQLVCDARADYVRSAARSLSTAANVDVTRETLGALYQRSRQLRRALDAYDAALKMELASGPIADGDGSTLSLAEVKVDKIVADKAWPMLIDSGFTEDDLAKCVSMSKKSVLDTIASKHKRGEKGNAKTALLSLLRANEAIREQTHNRIKIEKETTL